MKKIIAYKCEYCGKFFHKPHHCQKHEIRCIKNPENDRLCLHCNYLVMKDVEINEFDYNDIDTGRNVNVYFCNKLNKHLIPPKREIIGTWYSPVYDLDTGKEIKEMFMLKECEYEKI